MRHRFGPASRGSSSYHFKVMGWQGVCFNTVPTGATTMRGRGETRVDAPTSVLARCWPDAIFFQLNAVTYVFVRKMVGMTGFEPATP